ncbi:hypothetical protein E2C01_088893 [Portunus trituberculatus]|uniref:Uncharacterized protein n=1 Tax=Portunus trituberculatus TaxID=210409 RepID=A0A5B7JC18_PORTR|nr:hypothetical protein [Portunus trituberculatus]
MGEATAGTQPGSDGEDEGGVSQSSRQLYPQPPH